MSSLRPLSLLVLLLLGCGSTPAAEPSPNATPEPAPTPTPPSADPAPTPPIADPGASTATPPSSDDAAALAVGMQGFTAQLWRALAVPEAESAAIAPLSIAGALSMTAAGGRGATADEVWSALGISPVGARAPAVVAGASAELVGEELAVASRLFADERLPVEAAFVDLTRSLYAAPIERVAFAAPDVAIARINAWVSEQTHERVPTILPPGSVDATTALVLVNAMYFLGAWQTPFDPNATIDDYFAAPSGRVVCRMMERRGVALVGDVDGTSVLRLPYGGDRFVATFVLPPEGTALSSLEAQMTGELVGRWLAAPTNEQVTQIEIPRFRVADDAPRALDVALRALGIQTMFTPAADFTGIAPASESLYVSDVFHRVFVETTERGTEAAAATAVSMARGMVREVPHFRADRPFLFFVTSQSGLVLFVARVASPGQPGL